MREEGLESPRVMSGGAVGVAGAGAVLRSLATVRRTADPMAVSGEDETGKS